MMHIANAIILISGLTIAAYLVLLWFFALFFNKKNVKDFKNSGQRHKFAIIVPAHNEESTITKTLNSLANLDYASDNYQVFVIADNCNDRTSQISLEHNVVCFERFDKDNRGKGYALAFAFENIGVENFDGFVIVDADCELESQALKIFDLYFEEGYKILQANDISDNPDDSSMSYAVTVGNVIENELYYMPKDTLGLSVQLRGTGMVFHKEILQRYPWSANSMVEDMEYTMELMNNGETIRYVKETNVSSSFPIEQKQLEVQRTRWAGNLAFGKIDAFKIMIRGLVTRNLSLLDFGWSFFVLSRPLVLAHALFVFLFSFVFGLYSQATYSIVLACIVLSVQVIYIGTGILKLGITKSRLKLLLSSPYIVMRLMMIALKSLLGKIDSNWVRTPRD